MTEDSGTVYDVSQVGHIFNQIGRIRQKPGGRDEEEIRRWKSEGWPRVKKSRDKG